MRVLIGGGTGFVGKALTQELKRRGHTVTHISRSTRNVGGADQVITWDQLKKSGKLPGPYDAAINLSGASLFDKRWTHEYKQVMTDSRIKTTEILMTAIRNSKQEAKPSDIIEIHGNDPNATPEVYVCASAVGIYPMRQHAREFTEETYVADDEAMDEFPRQLCLQLEETVRREAAAMPPESPLRTVFDRSGVVLGAEGGAFPQMALPIKLGFGGWFGWRGDQPFPWIHIEDSVGIYAHAIERPEVYGPLNAVSPDSPNTTSKSFVKALAKAMHRPALVGVPGFALKLALGAERASLLLEGQRVVPMRTESSGYRFKFPTVESAVQDLASKYKLF
eukprot:GEZU01016000.1.p1 GENE.GEZU01016000.1~~GEZU01016000.1.p1  ORF type:complete len:335 (-),score=64.42 GEZU01016000.1:60-1064(-)